MKCPKIYVVVDTGSRDMPLCDPIAWFFDEKEADKFAIANEPEWHRYEILEVEAGDTVKARKEQT